LGYGGFGSVFLARKQSGRKVALKFACFDLLDQEDLEEAKSIWEREIECVLHLEDAAQQRQSSTTVYGTSSIVYFEDWFMGPKFACIVMNYADGGTLQHEIVHHRETEPYTERRIAWYALQLSGALAFAHEQGVAHHDVKSSNILIDRSSGGKLLLADWGSAVKAGEESLKMTKQYAAPELLAAVANDNFTGLEFDKIDAFGLGCILFELLCCQKQIDLMGDGDDVFGEYIVKYGVEAALSLPCISLPWLDEPSNSVQPDTRVGYTHALRGLVKTLLEPNPSCRWTPRELENPLRTDTHSPLLAHYLTAAKPAVPGTAVTVDNIQFGMFVQRGPHWNDGNADGGLGSIGAVVKLDPDAGFTEVAFPWRDASTERKPIVCRIGSQLKFELQVGPSSLKDFSGSTQFSRCNGICKSAAKETYKVGQLTSENWMVVSNKPDEQGIVVAPMQNIQIPSLPLAIPSPAALRSSPKDPLLTPGNWKHNTGFLVEVTKPEEKDQFVELFYAVQGGLDIRNYKIVSIQRVQVELLWTPYAQYRETLAVENWGIANEHYLFHGTGRLSPESLLLSTPADFYQKCAASTVSGDRDELHFSTSSRAVDRYAYGTNSVTRQLVISRVALGRVDDRHSNRDRPARPPSFEALEYHSVRCMTAIGLAYMVRNPFQCYPEYIITYNGTATTRRRVVRARRLGQPAIARLTRTPERPSQSHRPAKQRDRPHREGNCLSASTSQTTKLQSSTISTPPPVAAQGAAKTPESAASVVKECVVCQEREVSHILIPCGHPCLCKICATAKALSKLRHKCPECRATFREAIRFYGKVVEG